MHHMLHPEHDEPNLLKILKDNGYFVWWGGKNDLTPGQDPIHQYCNERFHPCDQDYVRWGLTPREGTHGGDLSWRGDPAGDNFFSFLKGKLEKGNENIYCDGDWAIVLGAIDKLRSYDQNEPICLYLPLSYPHPPYCVEEPWYSVIEREKLPKRAQHPENWEGKPSILKGIWDNQNLKGWSEDRWKELRATYYGMCSRLDHQFGMLIEVLREVGMYEEWITTQRGAQAVRQVDATNVPVRAAPAPTVAEPRQPSWAQPVPEESEEDHEKQAIPITGCGPDCRDDPGDP